MVTVLLGSSVFSSLSCAFLPFLFDICDGFIRSFFFPFVLSSIWTFPFLSFYGLFPSLLLIYRPGDFSFSFIIIYGIFHAMDFSLFRYTFPFGSYIYSTGQNYKNKRFFSVLSFFHFLFLFLNWSVYQNICIRVCSIQISSQNFFNVVYFHKKIFIQKSDFFDLVRIIRTK